MVREIRATIILAGATLAVLACFGTEGGAQTSADMRTALHISPPMVRICPLPQAGVKLLEDILQRMHRSQLALAKTKQTMAYQAAQTGANVAQQSLADPLLAIKPQEHMRKAPVPTKIAMLPPQPMERASYNDAFQPNIERRQQGQDKADQQLKKRKDATKEEALPVSDSIPPATTRDLGDAKDGERWKEDADLSKGEMKYEPRHTSPGLAQSIGGFASTVKQMSELQELANTPSGRRNVANGYALHNRKSLNKYLDEGRGGARQVGTKLASAEKELKAQVSAPREPAGDLRLSNENQLRNANNYDNENVRTYGTGSSSATNQLAGVSANSNTQDAFVQTEQGTINLDRPGLYKNIHEYGQNAVPPGSLLSSNRRESLVADEAAGTLSFRGGRGYVERSWESAGKSARFQYAPNLYVPEADFKRKAGQGSNRLAQKLRARAADGPAASQRQTVDLVAMLPPNVVTGIPLVRLGSSASAAVKALANFGAADKQQINGWTVLSLHRPQTREVSIQLYVKHEMVEAMRIFDKSLIPVDFGVMLGDELPTVKKRFGEPAFILTEQGGTQAGQNYVYPISQVCFQLARTGNCAPPQVVSLLIFNMR